MKYIAAKGMRANVVTEQGNVKVTDATPVEMDGNDAGVRAAMKGGIILKVEAPAPPAPPPDDADDMSDEGKKKPAE